MYKPDKLILTAGPSISNKEVKYVLDAVKNGWNFHMDDYVQKLEKDFAAYVGTKYAMTTSGATGALLISLATLGIGRGDEVILPDLTYFACSNVISLLGAKPVFVDVLEDTWCIDPEKIKMAITKRTRAIMPVHMYGNEPEMDEIIAISKKHNLAIVEDAAPAVGSTYKGRRPGTFGQFGAFSFQGAKIMVSGVGGMLVSNDKKLFEKAVHLNNLGEDPKKKFWQTSVAWRFDMSNVQAALALAQLERLEQFVKKKRQIYSWYKRRLSDIDSITLTAERPYTRSNMWMSSIILGKKLKIKRAELILKMKKNLVDTRPFFYPISMFPMYKEQDTPAAHYIGLHGINLPSGVNLTEEQVDYVSRTLRKLLS